MDLGWKLAIAVAVVGAGAAAVRVIAWAARRASRRRRDAAGHGLGDDRHRHTYAGRIADDQMAARRSDGSSWMAQEIAEASGWYSLPEPIRDGGAAPWQEPRS